MSSYVIDSTYVETWLLEDLKDPESDQVFTQFQKAEIELIAPLSLQSEVATLLISEIRAGNISKDSALETLEHFFKLPIYYIHPDVELNLLIALKHRITITEASYLSLALSGKMLILTKNENLKVAYSNTATTLSEPKIEYDAGPVSKKARKKQLEKEFVESNKKLLEQVL